MLNPEKLQQTITLGRQILTDRTNFDENERTYKLQIASNIAEVLRAAVEGRNLETPLAKAFGKPNNLTDWWSNDRFKRWVAEHPQPAREALRTIARADLSIEERVNGFLELLPQPFVSGQGIRLMLASFFLFGSDPEHLVPYRATAFEIAEALLGWPDPAPSLSPGQLYLHHLRLVQHIEDELRAAGLDVRDTLDAQGLLWWLTKSGTLEGAVWRGEKTLSPKVEKAIREYELEMAGPYAAELERLRTEYERAKPEFERLFGSPDAIADLRPADFFGFLNSIDARGQDGRGLFTMGIQLPRDPHAQTFGQLQEDLPALRVALQELLHGAGTYAERIDRMAGGPRVRRYIAAGLGIPSVLLFFQNPDASSGTLYMQMKEAKLRAAEALPLLPEQTSLGERYAAYESALVGLPEQYGRIWDWAQRRGFYWSSAFARNLAGELVDELGDFIDQFRRETGYPAGIHEADLAAREAFASDLTEEALDVLDWDRLKYIVSSPKYGSAGPQSVFNSHINDLDDEGKEDLREALRDLLYSAESLETRLETVLQGSHRGFGESVATKLLSIVHPDRVLPIFVTKGAKGKLALMRHPVLKLPHLLEGTPSEIAVKANDLLRDRLQPFFGNDTYGMKEFVYWLSSLQTAAQPGGSSAEPVQDDDLATLAARLFVDKEWLEEVLDLLRDRKQVILYGPPGTGKTYIAREIKRYLAPDGSRGSVVQFHPNYSYEDFVQGYRPKTRDDGTLTYELKAGPLLQLAVAAHEAGRGVEHVLIIDEINRGNLPKIFGELLYLLEYRNDEIMLMYGEEGVPFGLPENLLIIGTMNTADRSVGLIDAALRRRFHFVPLFPGAYPLDGFLERWFDANNPSMRWVSDVVTLLNTKLKDRFGPHLQVGHSHFTRSGLNLAALERVWEYDVMPLLQDLLFGHEAELASFTLNALRDELAADRTPARAPADGRVPLPQ